MSQQEGVRSISKQVGAENKLLSRGAVVVTYFFGIVPQVANDKRKEARKEYGLVTKEFGSVGKVFSSAEEVFCLAKLLFCRATKKFGRLQLLCKSTKLRCGLTTLRSCRAPLLSTVAEFLFCPAKLLCNRAKNRRKCFSLLKLTRCSCICLLRLNPAQGSEKDGKAD